MIPNLVKDSFCSFCGKEFTQITQYPRDCDNCKRQTWSNPTTVAVAMLVVESADGRLGLLIQKRNIEPKKGEWALTGGYIVTGETWQAGVEREVREELDLITDPSTYELFDVQHDSSGKTLLVFSVCTVVIAEASLAHFIPNEEVSEVGVMWEPMELAFPSHTDCANRFLNEIKEVK